MILCLAFIVTLGEYLPAACGSMQVWGACFSMREREALEHPWGPSNLLLLQLCELLTRSSRPAEGLLHVPAALGSAASGTLLDRGPSSCAAFLCGQVVQKLPRSKGTPRLAARLRGEAVCTSSLAGMMGACA